MEEMNFIKLTPTLDACVEIQAKRAYNQAVSELLKKSNDTLLKEKLETLKLFMETADFRKLRSESEKYLTEGKKVVFAVWQEKGKARWEMAVSE